MGFRLLIPPGDGQHPIVPKRPEVLGANAALQYSFLGSTMLAGSYTWLAQRYPARFGATLKPLFPTTSFLRSSAKVGVSAMFICSAVNWYYHESFTSIVIANASRQTVTPWKLFERTKHYTVDNGALNGACVGMVAGMSFIRLPIPWVVRLSGGLNIGAAIGIIASHAYLHYTGERQKAAKQLEEQEQRSSRQFFFIWWDRLLMSKLSGTAQHYVMLYSFFHNRLLPDGVYKQAKADAVASTMSSPDSSDTTFAAPSKADQRRRPDAMCYLEVLTAVDVKQNRKTLSTMKGHLKKLQAEVDYIATELCRKCYEYCMTSHTDIDERKAIRQEILALSLLMNKLNQIDAELKLRVRLLDLRTRHKEALDAGSPLEAWLPPSGRRAPESHVPTVPFKVLGAVRTRWEKEAERLERIGTSQHHCSDAKKTAKNDLDDVHSRLKAFDKLQFEMDARVKKLQSEAQVKGNVKDTPPDELEPSKP